MTKAVPDYTSKIFEEYSYLRKFSIDDFNIASKIERMIDNVYNDNETGLIVTKYFDPIKKVEVFSKEKQISRCIITKIPYEGVPRKNKPIYLHRYMYSVEELNNIVKKYISVCKRMDNDFELRMLREDDFSQICSSKKTIIPKTIAQETNKKEFSGINDLLDNNLYGKWDKEQNIIEIDKIHNDIYVALRFVVDYI
ncbi:MAG: hypothetical protein J7K26_00090 [Candidatus Aenigmarchaeota archaeon]|nr:hypothetical protein [Candidatus Aenigmarchaeota archaeon]